jgi:hypothetical protein
VSCAGARFRGPTVLARPRRHRSAGEGRRADRALPHPDARSTRVLPRGHGATLSPMRPLIGVIALVGLAFLLAEFFIVFLLPRRVRRDPAIARGVLRALWIPWRAGARLLPRGAADTMLGIFGPLGLLAILLLLSSGVILCFAGLHWAVSTALGSHHVAGFGSDLYFSAGAFFSATNPSTPLGGAGKVLQIAEAATGLGFLAIAIGYRVRARLRARGLDTGCRVHVPDRPPCRGRPRARSQPPPARARSRAPLAPASEPRGPRRASPSSRGHRSPFRARRGDLRGAARRLRASYEPYSIAISRHLALDLSDWVSAGDVREEWRAVAGRHG